MAGGFVVSSTQTATGVAHSRLPVGLLQPRASLFPVSPAQAPGEARAWEQKDSGLSCTFDEGGLSVAVVVAGGDDLRITGKVRNLADQPLALDFLRLRFLTVAIGDEGPGHAFFKNGYQSWTASHVRFPHEKDMRPLPSPSVIMQENMRNLPTCIPGDFASDGYAILGKPASDLHLLIGQSAPFDQFLRIRATFPDAGDRAPCLDIEHDFGGQTLAPGQEISLDPVLILADTHVNRLQDRYFGMIRVPAVEQMPLPTGWCSWYYYYTRISKSEMLANIDAARNHKVTWSHFVLDDGYQPRVGDWLELNARFPGSLADIAAHARAKGFTPGIWMAPFIAHGRSRIRREHPEWFLQNPKGRPLWAGWNPLWGLSGNVYGLDTTHPGFQEYLRRVVRTMVHEYGFRYLKLDFLFGATLPGKAHDPGLSTAQRLKLGFDLIREAAGPGVVILGCGCPLFPAIGKVDAMRIGPDVAPFWFAKYRYHLTRDPHALCTKFAIRSILTRAQMHRHLWLNDPDCLMLRETRTRLTATERRTLTDAIAVSGGMYLISDRLELLSDQTWEVMDKADRITRECDRGRAWPLDLMEHENPGWVYNTAGYLAAFNLEDKPETRRLELSRYLKDHLDPSCTFEDVWSGDAVQAVAGVLDLGTLPPRSSRLLRLVRD